MAEFRTIEQLSADLGVLISQLSSARSLLNAARRKRDQMYKDGDDVADIGTAINALLADIEEITDKVSTDLAALVFTFVPVIQRNEEQELYNFVTDAGNSNSKGHIYCTGRAGASGSDADAPTPFSVLSVGDWIRVEGCTDSSDDGIYEVDTAGIINSGNGLLLVNGVISDEVTNTDIVITPLKLA
jgi:hypothetical protein